MSAISERPEEGQGSVLPEPHQPLRWQDPEELSRWLSSLEAQVLDIAAVGKDTTRPLRRRFFSRHEARRRITEAEGTILRSISAVKGALLGNRPEGSPG